MQFVNIILLGIDIEFLRDDVEYLKIAQRFFSDQEYQYFKDCPQHEIKTLFFTLWTAKEAFIKALGTGLAISLQSFDIVLDAHKQPIAMTIRDANIAQHHYQIQRVVTQSFKQDQYLSALVSTGHFKPIVMN